MNIIDLGQFSISNSLPFCLIAGPCQIESLSHSLFMAESLMQITLKHNIPFIFKSSFDKANRTSVNSCRGAGIEQGLAILAKVKEEFHCITLTDVHTEQQCDQVGSIVDIIQIPAFLCRQTDLLRAAVKTGKIVNVKKGQFLAPWDMKKVYEKLLVFGCKNVLFTERGTCFGYNYLVSDMRSISIMAETGVPVIFDATHSVQQPGLLGEVSGGERKYVSLLAKAAVSIGIAGLYVEVHQDPDNAPSDGPCMLELSKLEMLLLKLKQYDLIAKSN